MTAAVTRAFFGCMCNEAAAALRLSQLLLDEPHWVRDKCVLVLGAGLGLEGLAAARVGASRVVLTDIGRWAGVCGLRFEA